VLTLHQKDLDRGLNLRVGEVVEVRSKDEILATLDSRGALDGLPFMPEMLAYCGQRFTVLKRAHKVCDLISGTGLRRMENTVLLDDLRCDGTAHGGCKAGCLVFWKEAWLRRVDSGPLPNALEETSIPDTPEVSVRGDGGCIQETLIAATRSSVRETKSDEESYSCQATEMMESSGEVVPAWDPGQYVQDIRSGNVGAVQFVRGFLKSAAIPGRWEWRHPLLRGKLSKGKTPSSSLNLQPGEIVRIKSRKEIAATLDTENKNRGLFFDKEMLTYCGRTARVRHRVDRIIDDRTGKMIYFKTDCVVLEDVVCLGEYRRLCPRRMYPFWREIWLERVTSSGEANGSPNN
jgi:hypothetical protein